MCYLYCTTVSSPSRVSNDELPGLKGSDGAPAANPPTTPPPTDPEADGDFKDEGQPHPPVGLPVEPTEAPTVNPPHNNGGEPEK